MSVEDVQGDGNVLSELALRISAKCRQPTLAPVVISIFSAACDVIVVGLVYWFLQYSHTPASDFNGRLSGVFGLVAGAAACVWLGSLHAYRLDVLQRPLRGVGTFLGIFTCAVVVLTALLSEAELSSVYVFNTLLAGGLVGAGSRLLLAEGAGWAVKSGLTRRRAVLVGGGEPADRLVKNLSLNPGNDIDVLAIFDDRDDTRSPAHVLEIPKVGKISDLVAFVRHSNIDLVIVTLPLTADRRIAQILEAVKVIPISIHLAEFSRDLTFRDRRGKEIFGSLAHEASYGAERRLAKRTFDLLIGTVALICLAPVMAVIAICIKLDSRGPVLFRQMRHGFNDSTIEVLKFRSMHHRFADPVAANVVTRNDPRVTRVGRLLRKSSLDELPQLFNVLAGTLSLVGPRPHAVDAQSSKNERFQRIVDGYSARHRLPPGITGWAQINGYRGEIDNREKLKSRVTHDLFYIENWSLWFDLQILLRTPLSLFDTRNAY